MWGIFCPLRVSATLWLLGRLWGSTSSPTTFYLVKFFLSNSTYPIYRTSLGFRPCYLVPDTLRDFLVCLRLLDAGSASSPKTFSFMNSFLFLFILFNRLNLEFVICITALNKFAHNLLSYDVVVRCLV